MTDFNNDPDIQAMEYRTGVLTNAVIAAVDEYDMGRSTLEGLRSTIRVLIAEHIQKTYDAAIMRGMEIGPGCDPDEEVLFEGEIDLNEEAGDDDAE